MLSGKGAKTQYTEAEAAELLGISVDQIRSLVDRHILDGDVPPTPDAPVPGTYSRSELLVLRFLAGQQSLHAVSTQRL